MAVQIREKSMHSGFLPAALALAVAMNVSEMRAESDSETPKVNDVASRHVISDQEDPRKGKKQEFTESLLQDVRLFNGATGMALEFSVNPWAMGDNDTSAAMDVHQEVRYRYDDIPVEESLSFYSHGGQKSRVDTVQVARMKASYTDQGILDDVDVPDTIDEDQTEALEKALRKAVRTLAKLDPTVLHSVDEDSTALIVAGGSQIAMTIYSSMEPIHPLLKVTVPNKGRSNIEILDEEFDNLVQFFTFGEKLKFSKKLNVVGVMATHKGSALTAVYQYLKDAANNMDYRKLRSGVLKFGLLGEGGWGEVSEYNRRVVTSLSRPAAPVHLGTMKYSNVVRAHIQGYQGYKGVLPDLVLTAASDDLGVIMTRISNLLRGVSRGNASNMALRASDVSQVRFVVSKNMADKIRAQKDWSAYGDVVGRIEAALGDDKGMEHLVENQIVADDNLDRNVEVNAPVSKRQAIRAHVRGTVRAFGVSAVVGGGLSTGIRIYDRYRQDGKLPHNYTETEMVKLAGHAARDGVYHGVGGAVAFNVERATGLPSPVVGAGIGVAHTLYDSYQAGKLTWENAAPESVRVGVESLAAGTAGWIGSGATTFIAGTSTPVHLTGALAGSLMGRYAYQYVLDRYGHALPRVLSEKPDTILKLH
ncbi:hypothetical protein [Parendozoicomonas sp. Alg238-R29]|uniref:hypothetical protein n=1 Tax=Parendozoicomonas sp. Alg238-R29 TaxID=2993446 RepID=UPI00248E6401|nr:hypothetical protein [Parendozoicomonas sp. Alg238-R29]